METSYHWPCALKLALPFQVLELSYLKIDGCNMMISFHWYSKPGQLPPSSQTQKKANSKVQKSKKDLKNLEDKHFIS